MEGFHELHGDEGLEAASGIVVYRFDAPLFFANAHYFVDQAMQVFDRADADCLVLDFEAVTLIDATAARALKRLIEHVTERHAQLSFARTTQAVVKQITDAWLASAIDSARFHPTVSSAVQSARSELSTAAH